MIASKITSITIDRAEGNTLDLKIIKEGQIDDVTLSKTYDCKITIPESLLSLESGSVALKKEGCKNWVYLEDDISDHDVRVIMKGLRCLNE